MFGRTVSGFGSRAKRGGAPLSISITNNADEVVEAAGPAAQTIQTNAGQIDVTGVASGGTAPYSFSWGVTEASDTGNATVAAAGTQNVANYNTLVLQTVLPGPGAPPVEAQYILKCTVTDSTTATASTQVAITLVSVGL